MRTDQTDSCWCCWCNILPECSWNWGFSRCVLGSTNTSGSSTYHTTRGGRGLSACSLQICRSMLLIDLCTVRHRLTVILCCMWLYLWINVFITSAAGTIFTIEGCSRLQEELKDNFVRPPACLAIAFYTEYLRTDPEFVTRFMKHISYCWVSSATLNL